MIEIIFWGGPKDGHIEYRTSIPISEVYCIDNNSELLDLFDVYKEKNKADLNNKIYSIYKVKKLSKGKYKYVYNGLL